MTTTTQNHPGLTAINFATQGLTDGSYRASTSVDNNSPKYVDARVGGLVTVGTTPTAGGTIEIFAYGRNRTGAFTAGCSGTDGAYTADGEEGLLKPVEVIVVDATSDQGYEWGPWGIAALFRSMPEDWGLVCLNNTGATFHTTAGNHVWHYEGVTYDNA